MILENGTVIRLEFPRKEVERLLESPKEGSSLGNYALIFTAIRAGLREGERAGLTGATFDLAQAKVIQIATSSCSGVTTDAGHAECLHQRATSRAGSI